MQVVAEGGVSHRAALGRYPLPQARSRSGLTHSLGLDAPFLPPSSWLIPCPAFSRVVRSLPTYPPAAALGDRLSEAERRAGTNRAPAMVAPHPECSQAAGKAATGLPGSQARGAEGRLYFAVPRGEGPDLAWSASGVAGSRGASGCLAWNPISPQSVPVRAVSARLRVGDCPQGPPAVQLPMTLPQARPGQPGALQGLGQ